MVSKFEKSENQAMEKAEESLRNAIESEKKYLAIKGEFDRICKEKETIHSQFKKLQENKMKEIAEG